MTGFFDPFTDKEAHGAETMMRDLEKVDWAQPLLKLINDRGGLNGINMPLFFELRFGHALHTAGLVPSYEIPGDCGSTIDYGFDSGGYRVRVELMRLNDTAAVRAATHEIVDSDGVLWISRFLSTGADDAKASEEGETLKAVQRICQKCELDGKPHKFPPPNGALNVLLVDFRTFLDGGDLHDRLHVALGGSAVRAQYRLRWKGKLITGVFSPETNLRGGAEARSRIHFIGFVAEKAYGPGDFSAATQLVANPNLIASAREARAILATWPLQPAELIA